MVTLDAPVRAPILRAFRASSASRTPAIAVSLGTTAAVVGLLGSWIPSYWGDEAASVMSATRPLASLASELTTVDAVHGVYYLFLHAWTAVFGTSELATRAPSAIGVGFLVAGTVVLARQFRGPGFASLAGVICMILPRTTYLATETRSYALGTAAAVWVTVLFVSSLRRSASRWWVAYGIALAASAYLFLYLFLMLAVHLAYLLVADRAALRAWARGAAVAALLAAPMGAVGFLQRSQIAFLANRDYATFPNVVIKQWFDAGPWVAVAFWAFILLFLLSLIAFRIRGRGDRSPGELGVGQLASLWLALPTVILLVGNAFVSPMYNIRYLSFGTPAAALLVASGVAVAGRVLTHVLRGRGRIPIRVITVGVLVAGLVAVCVPGYLAQRSPFAKDGGSDWRQVSEYLAGRGQPGQAVIFDQTTKPSRDPRLALRLYPAGFSNLQDVELVTPYQLTNGLWDRVAPLSDVAHAPAFPRTVWAVELPSGTATPADVQYLQTLGYRAVDTVLIHRTVIYQLVKE